MAALVDAVDVVLIAPRRHDVRATTARRLTARIRERGTVLIVIGDHWPEVPDVSLIANASRWVGVGTGNGHLAHRAVDVVVSGRRGASRERCITIEFDPRS